MPLYETNRSKVRRGSGEQLGHFLYVFNPLVPHHAFELPHSHWRLSKRGQLCPNAHQLDDGVAMKGSKTFNTH